MPVFFLPPAVSLIQFAGRGKTNLPSIVSYKQKCRYCRLKRKALEITDTELKLIAAAAIIGLSKRPKNGYKIPAATGTPRAL